MDATIYDGSAKHRQRWKITVKTTLPAHKAMRYAINRTQIYAIPNSFHPPNVGAKRMLVSYIYELGGILGGNKGKSTCSVPNTSIVI